MAPEGTMSVPEGGKSEDDRKRRTLPMVALKEMIEAQQRLIEDLRDQARVIEARGGRGDKEAAAAIRVKIDALQGKLDALKARQGWS